MVYLGDSYYQNKFDNKTRLQNATVLSDPVAKVRL